MHTTSILFALLGFLSVANGHGLLTNPKPTFTNPSSDPTTYSGVIDGYKALPGGSYSTSPQDNTISYTRQFKASKYKTLLELVNAQGDTGGECGITRADGDVQPLPADGKVQWGHGSEGFVSSHEGPCELWCDSTRVYQNDNCARNIPDGAMPIDVSQCRGAKKLVMLWLAMHTAQWQVYKNCVRLSDAAPTPSTYPPTLPPSPSSSQPTPTPDPAYTPTPSNSRTRKPSASPSQRPTVYPSSSPKPSPQPSPSTPSGSKAKPWQQCGGGDYQGPTHCTAGFLCRKWGDFYSQCVPDELKSDEVDMFGRCGGIGHTGLTKCKAGSTCQVRNDYYSQCVPYEG